MTISRQFSFINNKVGYTMSLLTGNSLIKDIVDIHNIGPNAFDFYKKTILGSAQFINFLKPGETLGFYIDSEEPYFRFKIEMSHLGAIRTLLLPEEFKDFPNLFTGKCRINKVYANKSPYTSVIDYQKFKIEDLPNEVMAKSYQTNSHILISDNTENSLMITKLPPTNINKKIDDFESLAMPEFLKAYDELIQQALKEKSSDVALNEKIFKKFDFSYLGSKEIRFHCPCSQDRMIKNFHSLPKADLEDIFKEQNSIETRCDYCNTIYIIKKEEIFEDLQ